MIDLSSVEVELITQLRSLENGEIRITVRNGEYAKAETIQQWPKDIHRPRRKQPAKKKAENKP